MKNYRSSIPKSAKERVTARYKSGAKEHAEYWLSGGIVGYRSFHETGELSDERPYKNGLKHGRSFRSDVPGKILSSEAHFKGKPHGIAKQYSDDEKLLGTYTMRHGNGVDLWWQTTGKNRFLSEVRFLKDGYCHGFTWWINDDEKSVYEESHFWQGLPHGIERHWNGQGKLRRGYPKYWIHGKAVTKRQYLSASAKDKTLPAFKEKDNRPQRITILEHIKCA